MMTYFRRCCAILALVTLLAGTTLADEGMWPLYLLDKLPFDSLQTRGLILKPQDIYNSQGTGIASAVVQVSATGSFVSPEGLILTNHHVAYDAIEEQSSVEHNYLRDGFYAPTKAGEKQAVGYRVSVTLGMEDVTSRVLAVVNDTMTDLQRYKAVDQEIKKIVKETEAGGDIKCRVATMFSGKQYVKYTFMEIRDVRIVYVPPMAIGNFGGDIDNWMWPRHTGDFSFLRAYVAPDGKPADYAKENVPYKPKSYLPVSSAGVREHDFAMTLGFPGSTRRYISSFELENAINFTYPRSIHISEDQLKIRNELGAMDSALALAQSSDIASINNRLKKNYGTMEGLTHSHILQKKQTDERGLAEFLKANPALDKKVWTVLPELDSLYRANKVDQERDATLSQMMWGCTYLRLANTLYRWSVERQKPDMQRERGFMDRDTAAAIERLTNVQSDLAPKVDKELLKYSLHNALALPANQKIDLVEKMFPVGTNGDREKQIDQFVENAYARTIIGTTDQRLKMFALNKADLENLHDPFVDFAAALYPMMETSRERDRVFSGAETRLTPKLIQAYAEWKQEKMYPDANGTMRLSYGEVHGYQPRDAVSYDYETTLSGVIEKESRVDPFIVPKELSATFASKGFRQLRRCAVQRCAGRFPDHQ